MSTLASKYKCNPVLAHALLALVYLALLFWASPNLRGSDQYWYVGDVERVVLGDGQMATNSVFPLSMPGDLSQLPRPWVQNKPATYAVLPLAYVTQNGHAAWLLFNVFCLFGSAWLVGLSLQLGKRRLLVFTALFVFFPFNFYLASQALPEIFVMLLLSAILYVMLRAAVDWKNALLLALLTGLLYWQRSNYVLLLAVVPIVYGVVARKKALVPILIFVVASEALFQIAPLLFAEHLVKSPSMLDIVLLNEQGKSNMEAFLHPYDNSGIKLLDLIPVAFEKLRGALVTQFEFGAPSVTLMFYLINLLLPALLLLLCGRRLDNRTKLTLAGLTAIHLATIVLFYNQYRYASSVIPVLFFANVYLFSKWQIKQKLLLRYVFLAGCIAFSLLLGRQLRSQSLEEKEMVNNLRKIKHMQPQTGALLCEYNGGGCLSVGYAMNPQTVFYFPKDYTAQQWLQTAAKLQAYRGVVYSESALYKALQPHIIKELRPKGSNLIYFETNTHEH